MGVKVGRTLVVEDFVVSLRESAILSQSDGESLID